MLRLLAALAVLLLARGLVWADDEIVGLEGFGGSARARAVLEERGFVVTEETRHQIFSFYVNASCAFVTTDALLHTYFANVEESLAKLTEVRRTTLVEWIDAMHADASCDPSSSRPRTRVSRRTSAIPTGV